MLAFLLIRIEIDGFCYMLTAILHERFKEVYNYFKHQSLMIFFVDVYIFNVKLIWIKSLLGILNESNKIMI